KVAVGSKEWRAAQRQLRVQVEDEDGRLNRLENAPDDSLIRNYSPGGGADSRRHPSTGNLGVSAGQSAGGAGESWLRGSAMKGGQQAATNGFAAISSTIVRSKKM
ncbi:unnamed protein product, partial [Sphacelaria rigidula]